MEKIKARYLIPLHESNAKSASIQTKGLSFVYATLEEEHEKRIKAQMSEYTLHISGSYEYEYDDDDDGPTRSYGSKDVELSELLSLSSPVYSTDQPRADILVVDGSFVGVILRATSVGGNGWDNYNDWWYCLLYTDGSILGKNESSYSFSGASSSKYEETTYTLRKKEKGED